MGHQISTYDLPYLHHWAAPDLQLATLFLFLTAANSGAGFPDITKTKVFFATWLDANTNCLTNLDLYSVIKETYLNVCLQKGKV